MIPGDPASYHSPALILVDGLRRAGWLFQHIRDDTGELTEIRAVYVWPRGHADGLIMHGETDAAAIRSDPDDAVLWYLEGTVVDVIAGLLELPPPGARAAPRLAIGWRSALWTP